MADQMPETYTDLPYGGLFGDTNQIKVIRQVVADPYGDYRPKELEALVEASAPSVRRVLKNLTCIGLLIKNTSDKQHPVYRVNVESPIYLAMTFLAYAVSDHRNATHYMQDVIADYYSSELRMKYEPSNAFQAPSLDKTLVGDDCWLGCFKSKIVPYEANNSLSQGELYKAAPQINFNLDCTRPEVALA